MYTFDQTKKNILDKLFFTGNNSKQINGRMKPGTLVFEWYKTHNEELLYNSIMLHTHFLDKFNPSFRERIYYIQNDLKKVVLCEICGKFPKKFMNNTISLAHCCKNNECRSQYNRENIKIIKKNISNDVWNEARKKISLANRGSFEDRFGKERADIIKNKLRQRNLGKIQSESTKMKRYISRKNNGKPWHSDETKEKIKQSNIITSNNLSKEDRLKIHENGYKKQSITMKNKILNGSFTPNITNSWTHFKSYVNLENGTIKKFRSNWEAVFWLLNDQLLYEKIRVPYYINNKFHIYITDFYDKNKKIIYEIKPNSLKNNNINIIKRNAVIKYCNENDMQYIEINDDWYKENSIKINYKKQPQLYNSMKGFLKSE